MNTPIEITKRRGRRWGIAAFALLVSGVTAWWSQQILVQVFHPGPDIPVEGSCEEGLERLFRAVEQAHVAASAEMGSDRAVVDRFRKSLGESWATRHGLRKTCQGDPHALAAIEQIEALAYAEERAIRYEASQVLPERRRIQSLMPNLWSKKPGQR